MATREVFPLVRRLVVGLGNPGDKFHNTRHNIGKMALQHFLQSPTWTDVKAVHGESMVRQLSFEATQKQLGNDLIDRMSERRKARTVEEGVPYPLVDVHGLLPSTYMNRSGMSVKSYLNAHSFRLKNNALVLNKHDELLVLTDDITLPFGTCRFKPKGGHGGQNGVRDIIKCIASEKFARLKIGIGCPSWFVDAANKGNPPPGLQLDKYVLGKFQPHEQDDMRALLEYTSALLRVYLHRGLNEATALANSTNMKAYKLPPKKKKGPPPHLQRLPAKKARMEQETNDS
ncbi:peptidyl-tRNA hydrolase [Achlya hypogyna]|uniref:Peptidyl-tRNA hydrolase n=1 Tax=Achlya hypogyna TaxID=1202772 RepID=A0A1V9Z253_ACHHY|nr:peptidyl-tRNA hydrolase [Achlya hypogyna]